MNYLPLQFYEDKYISVSVFKKSTWFESKNKTNFITIQILNRVNF